MTGRGRDGEELEAGDTYHSLETISEDSAPETVAEGELLPDQPTRPIPTRPGLPLTEAVARLLDRVEHLENRDPPTGPTLEPEPPSVGWLWLAAATVVGATGALHLAELGAIAWLWFR